MTEFTGEGREDRTLDEADELTKLEYKSASSELSAEEQQRLAQLRQDAGQLISAEQEKATESELTNSTPVSGDDSP